ncbi:MAG: DUF5060 domain-containing protein [Lachnospiraceae bacterium]|jgi:hypothetical protein|nr:DUF5060 domain-containing protein [Lachnospiraceae bacterium]
MKAYQTFELTIYGPALAESYAQIDLSAEFTNEDVTVAVRGFYDGEETGEQGRRGVYKVRFLPEKTGLWKWKVSGVVTASGEELCEKAPESSHGPVHAEDTHFVFSDGSRYLPFGTTVYALANQDDALVSETIASMKQSPFNKVRMCVFPKHYNYNHNEPPYYAFRKIDGTDAAETGFSEGDGSQWDVTAPDIRFWKRFEKICSEMMEAGIQIDLILFHPYDRWGFSRLSTADCLIYLDYLLRRFSAYPGFWWSMANEYDLMDKRTEEDWRTFGTFLQENDPYRHLLSNHNCFQTYDFSEPYITHCCIQSSWTKRAAQYITRYGKPVIYDEMRYEGNLEEQWGNISAFELVDRFWTVCAQGAYGTHGETFLRDDEIVWWARGGKLTGESPVRIAWLKDFLYSLPGTLTPIPGMWDRMTAPDTENEKNRKQMIAAAPEATRPFISRILSLSAMDRELFALNESLAAGQVGEQCRLYYYGRQCPGRVTLSLPCGKKYKVEILDVWNMTRETVYRETEAEKPEGEQHGLSADPSEFGRLVVPMPGREGMAVLATALQQ